MNTLQDRVRGIAGFTPEEIGPLFKDAIDLENVILPKEFVEGIGE